MSLVGTEDSAAPVAGEGQSVPAESDCDRGQPARVADGDSGDQICIICQDVLGQGASEALLCGHVFHSLCINEYVSCAGKTKATCCPFKCPVRAEPDADALMHGTTNAGPELVPEVLVSVAASEAAAAAQQLIQ